MAIESNCTGCGNKLAVGDEHAGKRARCPACGNVYTVGQPGSNAADSNSPAGGDQFAQSAPADEGLSGSGNAFALDETTHQGDSGNQSADQYWMKAVDGTEYGPVDRPTLNRWFQEGRIAANYTIRQGATGNWLAASAFQPIAATSGNPYSSAAAPHMATGAPIRNFAKADQSGIILAMGILSFFVCGIFGIVAWVMGHNALKDIQTGAADPTNKGLIQVGYYMGMASVILHLVCGGGYIVFIAFLIASGA